MRYDLFFGIGVLNSQAAGITGQKNSLDRPLPAFPNLDQFVDVTEMIEMR